MDTYAAYAGLQIRATRDSGGEIAKVLSGGSPNKTGYTAKAIL